MRSSNEHVDAEVTALDNSTSEIGLPDQEISSATRRRNPVLAAR